MKSICVLGAGSIGCYVGARLAGADCKVSLVGRERLRREIAEHGLHWSDLLGASGTADREHLHFVADPGCAAEADLVLVTVKSAATQSVGESLARVLRPGTLVISFQNGLGNAEVLRETLIEQTVLSGMVPFNVVQRGAGRFHQGSAGALDVEDHPALQPWLSYFEAAGLPLKIHAQMLPVQWAKLLLNLNNPINALSNLPLKAQLSERAYRQSVALAQAEAIELLDQAGLELAKLTPLPPRWIPRLLAGPNWLFRVLANRMLAIDPLARSSMWEDLQAGRVTEVDWLNGEVVRLAERLGRSAPINAKLLALIRAAESGGRRQWSGPELLEALLRAGK